MSQIVDFHVHLFPPEVAAHRAEFAARDAGFAQLYANPKARLPTLEQSLADLTAGGVDHAVVLGFGWSDAAICAMHNDYLADAVQHSPKRLTGFGCVQPASPGEAVAELHRFPRLRLRGVGELMPHLQGYSLADRSRIDPVAEAAASLGLVLLTHSSEPLGHVYPGKGDVAPRQIAELAERWPELRIVAAHWGGGLPFYTLMPEIAAATNNVWYDSAASHYLYRPDVFRVVRDLVGARRILLGTDYPLVKPGPFLRKVRAVGLTDEDLDLILGGNAAELLGPADPP